MSSAVPLQFDEWIAATPPPMVAAGSNDDFRTVAFQVCPAPMLVVRLADGLIVDANPAFRNITGDSLDPSAASRPGMQPRVDDWLDWRKPLLESDASEAPQVLRLRKADGTTVAQIATLHRCGADLLLLVFRTPDDLTPREFAAETTDLDPLTGLPSRSQFDARLERALQRVQLTGQPHFAVMFMDLDAFKPVNDQFGHAIGDRVLVAAAKRLAAGVRPGDLLSRRGGDEFTLLVECVEDAHEARRIAERLWKRAMEPFEVDGHFLHVGVSIGIVLGDGTIDTPEAIVDAADRAMYAAKRFGRPILHPIA